MISVNYANGLYEARKGLTGEVIYHGPDPAAMGKAIARALLAMVPSRSA